MKKLLSIILGLCICVSSLVVIPVAVTGVAADEQPMLYAYGDANDDHAINAKDVLILRQHLAHWETDIDSGAADSNADCNVNSKDLLLLRQYLAKWDVSLGLDNCSAVYESNQLLKLLTPTSMKWAELKTDKSNPLTMANIAYHYSIRLQNSDTEDRLSFVDFNLNGKYKTINFSVGREDKYGSEYRSYSSEYYYNNNQNNNDHYGCARIMCDGVIKGEYQILPYATPVDYTLDVTGVNTIRFYTPAATELPKEYVNDGITFGSISAWESNAPEQKTALLRPSYKNESLCNRSYIYNTERGNFINVRDGYTENSAEKPFVVTNRSYNYGIAMCDSGNYDGGQSCYINLKGRFKYVGFVLGHLDTDPYVGQCALTIKVDEKTVYEKIVEPDMDAEFISVDVNYGTKLKINYTPCDNTSLHYPTIALTDITGYATTPNYVIPRKTAKDAALLISQVEQPYCYPDMLVDGWGGRLYNGSKLYGFTMAGDVYHEGFRLTPHFSIVGLRSSFASFNLDGVYKNMTFKVGHVDGTTMKDYTLKVLGDDKLLKEIELESYSLVKQYEVDVTGVYSLKFLIEGKEEMYHGSYCVADIVVYGGDVKQTDLSSMSVTEFPDSGKLLDIFNPYSFMCWGQRNTDDELSEGSDVFFKGDSIAKSFTVGGKTYNQGFFMEASEHLNLDTINMGAAVITGLAMLAADGGLFKSYAVFNLHNKYDTIKFKVQAMPDCRYDQTLEIVVEDEKVQTVRLEHNHGEYEFEVPLDKCGRFGFMLGGIDDNDIWEGRYAFYDLELS